jgi:hypothetical protein
MVFKSKVKESLYQELRAFILRYQSGLVRNTVKPMDTTDMLTRQIFVHLRITEDNAVLVHLVDKEGYPLFKLEFYFGVADGVNYVGIKYSDVDGLGSLQTFPLTDNLAIDNFLVQIIKFIPSETYIKHYLTVFKKSSSNMVSIKLVR